MKKLLQMMCICFCVSMVKAQEKDKEWNGASTNWSYDLTGTRDAAHITAVGSDVVLTKQGGATNFYTVGSSSIATPQSAQALPGWLPAPTGNSTLIQFRATSAAVVKYTLIKEDNNLKSVKIDATNALNKYIIRNIDNTKATAVAKYSFSLKTHHRDANGDVATPGYVRNYHLVFGSNSTGTTTSDMGSMYRGGNSVTNSETLFNNEAIFTSLRLAYEVGNSAIILTHRKVNTKYNATTSTNGTATYNTISNASFNADGTTANMELYCNNSADIQYYVVEGSIYAVQAQTFHLWINGSKINEYDIANAGQMPISIGKTFDSFMVFTTGTSTETAELGYGSIEISDFKVDYVSTTSSTLPVSLAAFTGTYNGDFVKLNWKTLSEKDNSHFEVLRSVDGNTFSEVTRVLGTGNSTDVINYTATDFRPLSGVNYYKLKQVDNSGDYSMSEVIAVNTSLEDSTLKIVKKDGVSSIMYYSETSSTVDLCVTDINGRKLYNQKMQVLAGKNKLNLDISFLRSGVHVLSVKGGESIQSIKFVN